MAQAIEIGYTLGYLVDLTTKAGIQLFFPATLRCVVPGNRKLRLSTGSNWEYGILVVDEEIIPRLSGIRDREASLKENRYPNAQMYLTGAVEVDEPEEINPQPKPQQLATVVKRGRKVEFNSSPLGEAVGLMREQWGSGQVRVRVVG